MSNFKILLAIFFKGSKSKRYLLGASISLALSMAIILSTLGIMDGFDATLKQSLTSAGGDFSLYKKNEFLNFDGTLQNQIKKLSIEAYTPMLQTKAFIVVEGMSKGVLLKGVDPHTFKEVTKLSLPLESSMDSAILGSELLKNLGVKKGDTIALVLAEGGGLSSSLPSVHSFKITGSIHHGIFEKDSRMVYIHREALNSLMGIMGKANLVLLKTPPNLTSSAKLEDEILEILGPTFVVRSALEEEGTLLEAIKVEKVMMTIVLQVIVIIAIFNIIAFFLFISEKKIHESFLLFSLGLSRKDFDRFWKQLAFSIWCMAILISFLLIALFSWLLQVLPIFQLPGEIYTLSVLKISLQYDMVLLVFAVAYLWILVALYPLFYKIKKMTLLDGLRKGA